MIKVNETSSDCELLDIRFNNTRRSEINIIALFEFEVY